MSGRNSDADSVGRASLTGSSPSPSASNLHQRNNSSSSSRSTKDSPTAKDLILLTPYPVGPGHTLITIVRLNANDWKPEVRSNTAYVAEGDNAGIIINKPASIMDYNKVLAGQKERQQPPNAKMSFKVFLINSDTNKLTLEHRTLRFWLDQSPLISSQASNNNGLGSLDDDDDFKSTSNFINLKQESSQLAQAYFRQLLGSKTDDFPKNYVGFIMKLMRLLKGGQFVKIIKMEVELRQLPHDDQPTKPPSPTSLIDGGQSGDGGRRSPLTSQNVLDIIESSYPNPISVREICSTTQTSETIVRQFVSELAQKEKISSTDDGQHYTRTTKPIDTKVNLVKQMPKVTSSQQPVIAIITAQYCEKLAVDSMISDKETFVRYRVAQDGGGSMGNELSANYVYTLGNIGHHRVVSTKLPSVGHSRGALIAAGNATTRLLGTFPEIEYVFLVGCGGGVANYTDFSSHVRLGDIVVSHQPTSLDSSGSNFKLCRPAKSDLQKLAQNLWLLGLGHPKHRIWEYYIDEGIKTLKQQDIEATRPIGDTDKLFMSIGVNDSIEVSHPEADEGEIDLRQDGRPMCHFGPIGSVEQAQLSEPQKQRMISEFGLRAFDSGFDSVVESIHGNCKESYLMIRGISDYKDGRKKKEWQQYSALVAAAFMKSIIINLKSLD